MKVLTVIQTRMGSTRLPGKVMKPLGGKPAFVRMVERVRQASLSGAVVVATTGLSEDDVIKRTCEREGISYYCGHPTDLLDRHYQAALAMSADAVVKIPSDCPLIDPDVIDRVLSVYLTRHDVFDYVSNLHPATYPDGNDVEVMSLGALECAWREARKDFEREHTTPYIWANRSLFNVGNVVWEKGLDCSTTHRWVLDYEEDYQVISAICEALSPLNPAFGVDDIMLLLDRRPDLRELNRRYLGVSWQRNYHQGFGTLLLGQTGPREPEVRL